MMKSVVFSCPVTPIAEVERSRSCGGLALRAKRWLGTAIVAAVAGFAMPAVSVSHAQGFSAQELDRMSKERLDQGHFRNFAAPPAPPKSTVPIHLHQPRGLWVCLGIPFGTPVHIDPGLAGRVIGQSGDHIAASGDVGDATKVMIHEGVVGYVPTSAVHPYHNQYDAKATCAVQGLRPDGMVQYGIN